MKTTRKNYKRNRYTSRYNLGGKRMYQYGGSMYDTNEAPRGMQSTANIVYQESDPAIQAERQQALAAERARITEQSAKFAQEIEADKAYDESAIKQASQEAGAKVDTGLQTAQRAMGFAEKTGVLDKLKSQVPTTVPSGLTTAYGAGTAAGTQWGGQGAGLGEAFKSAADAYRTQKAVNQAIKAGTLQASSAGTAGSAGLSTLGQGLGSFAKSGAGIGTIASLAGMGVSRLSEDDDPTKMNFGEGAGTTLSGIGTGIGAAATTAALMGSTLGPLGTAIGGGLGAIYGLGKGFIQRGKARKEEALIDREREQKILGYNVGLTDQYSDQLAALRAAQLRGKTYSGYNLGQNIAAQLGGLRMGMPRYSYT